MTMRASPIEMYGVSQASPDVTKRGQEPFCGTNFSAIDGTICTSQKPSFFGDALTVCVLWCLSIPLISKNSLLKPALPEESIAMSFRRDETGLSATCEGAIERPKYRAIERRDLQEDETIVLRAHDLRRSEGSQA